MIRLVGILLVFVMIVGCASAVAETERSRKDSAEAIKNYNGIAVEALLQVYDDHPDKFDADYIYLLFGYVMSYYTYSDVFAAETLVSYHSELLPTEIPIFSGEIKELGIERGIVYRMLTDAYIDWTQEKKTDADIMEILYSIGKGIVAEGKK